MTADDYFALFGLPARQRLDAGALEKAWRELAARVHPDRYATASPAEKRVVMQWAATINEAYQVLRQPLQRARYLCERAGQALEEESNTSMAPGFLMQQMEWREQLEQARDEGDAAGLEALRQEVAQYMAQLESQVARLLDEQNDAAQAARHVREWMFVDKLTHEIQSVRTNAARQGTAPN